MTFLDHYHKRKAEGVNLCVGIDPTPQLLTAWGLEESGEGLLRFGRVLVEASAGQVAVVKPQVAFFERLGMEGYRALSTIIAEARERGLLVIADGKRGDIGSTMQAYAEAWIGPEAPFSTDAVTANAYLGLGALEPLLARAADCGAYVFVVVRSSNPEASCLQLQGEPPVWKRLLADIREWCEKRGTPCVGAVVGATVIAELEEALGLLPDGLFLAPGIGKQGATMDDVTAIGAAAERVLASASRSIAEAGPDVGAVRAAIANLLNA